MTAVSEEILRKCVKEHNFKSTDDILAAVKEKFEDVLYEALESLF